MTGNGTSSRSNKKGNDLWRRGASGPGAQDAKPGVMDEPQELEGKV